MDNLERDVAEGAERTGIRARGARAAAPFIGSKKSAGRIKDHGRPLCRSFPGEVFEGGR